MIVHEMIKIYLYTRQYANNYLVNEPWEIKKNTLTKQKHQLHKPNQDRIIFL